MAEKKYDIEHLEKAQKFVESYKFTVSTTPIKEDDASNTDEVERIIGLMQKNLEKIHESMVSVQDKLLGICNKRREEAEDLKKRVNGKLEELFTSEDALVQGVLEEVRRTMGSDNPDQVKDLTKKVKLELVTGPKYSLKKPASGCSLDGYDLAVTEEVFLECLCFEERKPTNFSPAYTEDGEVSLSFSFFSEEETALLKPHNPPFNVELLIWEKGQGGPAETHIRKYTVGDTKPVRFSNIIVPGTGYCLNVRVEYHGIRSDWSEVGEFVTPEFKEWCMWKECPNNVPELRKYSVDEKNPRVATSLGCCIIVGKALLPPNKTVSWNIKVLKSAKKNGDGIYIGVAPYSIGLKRIRGVIGCGWYFEPAHSRLYSGPPHNYFGENKKYYGSRNKLKLIFHAENSVGVVMDTTLGTLSYSINGKSYGVAYEDIPLDKPLVPCVVLKHSKDSVGIEFAEAKDSAPADKAIPAPSNITAKNLTWDSITLTWDDVEGASFYQVEVDGSKFWGSSKINAFTKIGFLAETEHTFRVRAVKEKEVSEWSDVVKGRTHKEAFETSGWKECPDYVDEYMKYTVDGENPRIATSPYSCVAIGNTALPLNQVTSWSIKILESRMNNGFGILIGVAPSDIDQNEDENYEKCGWYFHCYGSALCSGPPHNYRRKEYGPRKEKVWGEYVRDGDSVGAVMDTEKGELSFALNGVNYGAAFEGIPLDKPLVPCAYLNFKGSFVELVI